MSVLHDRIHADITTDMADNITVLVIQRRKCRTQPSPLTVGYGGFNLLLCIHSHQLVFPVLVISCLIYRIVIIVKKEHVLCGVLVTQHYNVQILYIFCVVKIGVQRTPSLRIFFPESRIFNVFPNRRIVIIRLCLITNGSILVCQRHRLQS